MDTGPGTAADAETADAPPSGFEPLIGWCGAGVLGFVQRECVRLATDRYEIAQCHACGRLVVSEPETRGGVRAPDCQTCGRRVCWECYAPETFSGVPAPSALDRCPRCGVRSCDPCRASAHWRPCRGRGWCGRAGSGPAPWALAADRARGLAELVGRGRQRRRWFLERFARSRYWASLAEHAAAYYCVGCEDLVVADDEDPRDECPRCGAMRCGDCAAGAAAAGGARCGCAAAPM